MYYLNNSEQVLAAIQTYAQVGEAIQAQAQQKNRYLAQVVPDLICELGITSGDLIKDVPHQAQPQVAIISVEEFRMLFLCQKAVVAAIDTGILRHPVVVFQEILREHLGNFSELTRFSFQVDHSITGDSSVNYENDFLLTKMTMTDSEKNCLLTLSCRTSLPTNPYEKLVISHLVLQVNDINHRGSQHSFFEKLRHIFPVNTVYFDIYRLTYFGKKNYMFFQENRGQRKAIFPPFSNKLLGLSESVTIDGSIFCDFKIDVNKLLAKMHQTDNKAKMEKQLAVDLLRMKVIVQKKVLQIAPKINLNSSELLSRAIHNEDIMMTPQQNQLLCYLLVQGYLSPYNKAEVELQSFLGNHDFAFQGKTSSLREFHLTFLEDANFELTVTRNYRAIYDLNQSTTIESEQPFLTIKTSLIIPKNIQEFDLSKASSCIILPKYVLNANDKQGVASAHMLVKHKIWPIIRTMQTMKTWTDYKCTMLE